MHRLSLQPCLHSFWIDFLTLLAFLDRNLAKGLGIIRLLWLFVIVDLITAPEIKNASVCEIYEMVFESFSGGYNAMLTAVFAGIGDEVELLVLEGP